MHPKADECIRVRRTRAATRTSQISSQVTPVPWPPRCCPEGGALTNPVHSYAQTGVITVSLTVGRALDGERKTMEIQEPVSGALR